MRLERRSGKSVTVLGAAGLSCDSLVALLKELKALCATGGTVKGAEAELQGDHRERLRALLAARGILVKG
jgi:translation initiation factor 1